MLTIILAIDENNLVGGSSSKYGIPWHYPEDLKYYKQQTINKINIMGRKTYEAIGNALPNRDTYVMTTNKNLTYPDAHMLYSKEDFLKVIQNSEQEIMLVGGVKIFEEFFQYVDKALITRINKEHEGDVYFNNLNSYLSDFTLENETLGEDPSLKFQTWIRK